MLHTVKKLFHSQVVQITLTEICLARACLEKPYSFNSETLIYHFVHHIFRNCNIITHSQLNNDIVLRIHQLHPSSRYFLFGIITHRIILNSREIHIFTIRLTSTIPTIRECSDTINLAPTRPSHILRHWQDASV